MPSRRPPIETLRRAHQVFDATKTDANPKGDLKKAAKKLDVNPKTLYSWLQYDLTNAAASRRTKAELLAELVEVVKAAKAPITKRQYEDMVPHGGAFGRHWKSWEAFLAEALAAAGIAPETMSAREKQRYEDRLRVMKTDLRDAHRKLNEREDLRQAVFGLAEQTIDPPEWALKLKPGTGGPGIPLLFCSDFQWGEVISAQELDGINEFNRDVASRRYKRLIERTVDLATMHMVRPNYPGIVVVRGGDMISGDIHDELRKTNDLQSIPAAIDLIEHETAGLQKLADVFGHVWVVSIPGNHGRVTMKPESKRYVETNYDYLIACMIEREFRGDKRFTFHTPMSGDALFSVMGWRFLATHGDRVGSRGGQGFIGPAATIARGMKKVADEYAALGQTFHYQLFGHFHTSLELEYGWCNGSLPGYSEYARDFRARPSPPSQWLLFVHPKWGVTCRWPILLESRPKLAEDTTAVFGALKAA